MLLRISHVRTVQGYKQRRAYIATQGPLQNTVDDFWRMVWEHHCSCIVMLCDTNENGMVLDDDSEICHTVTSYHTRCAGTYMGLGRELYTLFG